jgi:hypothetical protein
MTALRQDSERLMREREIADRYASDADRAAWRDQLVAQALDFRTMATELKGPALRELVQLWLKRAEFNTETRELTMEIRRVPAMTQGGREAPNSLFEAERERSGSKGPRRNVLNATVIRKVIVGRRVA